MERDVNRSTRSGQFVKESTAERDPGHSTTEHVDGSAGRPRGAPQRQDWPLVTGNASELREFTTKNQHLRRVAGGREAGAVGWIALTGLWPCCGRSR